MNADVLQTTACHLLEGLAETGIGHLFSNFGTDHVSLIEAMALFARQGRPQPNVVWPAVSQLSQVVVRA